MEKFSFIPDESDEMANSADPDQTAPAGAVCRDFPRANLGPIIGPHFFPNRDRNSQIL